MYVRFKLWGFVFSDLMRGALVFASLLIFTAPASAMIQGQYDSVVSFCSGKEGNPAASTLGQSNANYWYGSLNLYGTNTGCDSSEPSSKSGWCRVRLVSCAVNGIYTGTPICSPSNLASPSGGGLMFTGGNCASLTTAPPPTTGCASPDNAGICDYVASVQQVAARAESLASSTADSVNLMNNSVDQTNNILTGSLYGTSSADGSYLSVGEFAARMADWSEWGVKSDIDFRRDNEVPFMQQSLAMLNVSNGYLAQISSSGMTIDTSPITSNASTNTANIVSSISASGASLRDVVENGNDTLVTIVNAQEDTKEAVNDVGDSLDALLAAQQDTTTAVSDAAEYLAQAYANVSPEINLPPVDLSPVTGAINSAASAAAGASAATNQKLDSIAGSLSGSVASPDLPSFSGESSPGSVGSDTAASVLGDVGEVASTVVNLGSLDKSGFLSPSSAVLPVLSFSIPMGQSGSVPIVWDISELSSPMNILRLFLWLATWFMVLNIVLGSKK